MFGTVAQAVPVEQSEQHVKQADCETITNCMNKIMSTIFSQNYIGQIDPKVQITNFRNEKENILETLFPQYNKDNNSTSTGNNSLDSSDGRSTGTGGTGGTGGNIVKRSVDPTTTVSPISNATSTSTVSHTIAMPNSTSSTTLYPLIPDLNAQSNYRDQYYGHDYNIDIPYEDWGFDSIDDFHTSDYTQYMIAFKNEQCNKFLNQYQQFLVDFAELKDMWETYNATQSTYNVTHLVSETALFLEQLIEFRKSSVVDEECYAFESLFWWRSFKLDSCSHQPQFKRAELEYSEEVSYVRVQSWLQSLNMFKNTIVYCLGRDLGISGFPPSGSNFFMIMHYVEILYKPYLIVIKQLHGHGNALGLFHLRS